MAQIGRRGWQEREALAKNEVDSDRETDRKEMERERVENDVLNDDLVTPR